MSEMIAAISPSFNARAKQNKPTKPPSESPFAVSHRRPKPRDVASRYLDSTISFSSSSLFQSSPSSTAKRCQSPSVTRTNRPATPSAVKNRPQSTGRRQSAASPTRRDSLDRRGSGGEVSTAERMLLASGRGLFASFQGNENRSKLNSSPITPRRGTLEKKKTATTKNAVAAQQEKAKLSEQWPRSLQPNCLSRSLGFTDLRKKVSGSCNGVARTLQNSDKVDCKISNGVRKISVNSPASSPKGIGTTRSQLFPRREQIRPASPNKFGMAPASYSSPRGSSIARGISPSRGVIHHPRGISPLRVRSSSSSNTNSTPLILDFALVAKKEKIRDRENGVADDAHLLRMFHNKLLQWRFANARANAVISTQKMRAERRLYNAFISISKLYDSVREKRIEMQYLKQNLKLISILNKQMVYLQEWFVMDRDYTSSLVGAAEALKGSTFCLPVDNAAMVNVQSVKDAICSAVDVMQAMASSICLLLPKVVKVSCLAAELNRVNVKEQGMLDVCKKLLNTISALQVVECSLRTQAIQLQC
ncbi:unnamed protein product [Thlaspi arvense]|uniref:Uncharacterized protein n=1 Tax=Thlaspi arvense TaxID=13288 RepID=A0AAU9RTV3_THLAR|nr:unnamed protein product [Thlaspi arvense]